MAFNSLVVNPTGAFAVTGGANITYTSIGLGKLSNMAADLSAPEHLEIQSTLANDVGKESSYLIKFTTYGAPPVGSPYGSPDPKLQAHMVLKADTSYWTQAQILNHALRLAHLCITPNFIGDVLRGNK